MTMTASSYTRRSRPRTAVGVAICERLRMRRANRFNPERREGSFITPAGHKTTGAAGVMKDPSAAPRPQDSLAAGAEQRRDGHLVGLLLGVEHEELLDGVDGRLQLVARALALDLQILNGA